MNDEVTIHSHDETTVTKNEKKDGYIYPNGFTDRDLEIILEKIIQNIQDFHIQSKPIRLSGGLLNYVWWIKGEIVSIYPSLIAKWASPFIASNSQIYLDPGRIVIDTNALKTFGIAG